MPMYDYECKACGNAFETIATLEEVPECPKCKSADTMRLIGAPMIPGKFKLHYSANWPAPGRPKSGPGRS